MQIQTSGAGINLVRGGKGPAVLLLHGYPQTHCIWHRIAPRLAEQYTVWRQTCAATATRPNRPGFPITATTPSAPWPWIRSNSCRRWATMNSIWSATTAAGASRTALRSTTRRA